MKRAAALFLLASSLVGAGAALGGSVGPCQDPWLFPDARVNVVVLPYEPADPLRRQLLDAGEQLAYLVKLRALFSILDYGSVGAVHLKSHDRRPCRIEEVLGRLVPRLRPGHGLVLVTGRVFEDGGSVFVQTSLRLLRGGPPETLEVKLPTGEAVTSARRDREVVFEPAELAAADLKTLQERYRTATALRGQPSAEEKPASDLPEFHAYSVIGREGEWIRVRLAEGRDGWIQASSGDSLFERLPELRFLAGLAGYAVALSYPPASPEARRTAAAADAQLRAFADAPDDSATTSALAAELRARLLLHAGGDGALGRAQEVLQDAAKRNPSSAEIRSLAAVLRLKAFAAGDTKAALQAAASLNAGLTFAPDDRELQANLLALYKAAQDPGKSRLTPLQAGFPQEKLGEQIAALEASRSENSILMAQTVFAVKDLLRTQFPKSGIDVSLRAGTLRISGSVPQRDVAKILKAVKSAQGVRAVRNDLTPVMEPPR